MLDAGEERMRGEERGEEKRGEGRGEVGYVWLDPVLRGIIYFLNKKKENGTLSFLLPSFLLFLPYLQTHCKRCSVAEFVVVGLYTLPLSSDTGDGMRWEGVKSELLVFQRSYLKVVLSPLQGRVRYVWCLQCLEDVLEGYLV